MKKILAWLLVLALAVPMFGCGAKEPPATSPNATTSPTETTGATTPTDGVFVKSDYTGSDEDVAAHRDTVVATLGDKELTNGVLQLYYWLAVNGFINEQGMYIYYYGLDPAKPLGQQPIGQDGAQTWQHYFLSQAITTWHRYQALALCNEEADIPMDPKMQADLDASWGTMEEAAKKNGFATALDCLQAQMGKGCDKEDYLEYQEQFYQGFNYYEHMNSLIDITDDEIEAYFTEHQKELEEQGVTKETMNYGVRHILIAPEGGTKSEDGKTTTYSDAEWEACRQAAQEILDQWKAGEATAESFGALAKEKSTDPGSKDNGGLYDGLDKNTSFVQPFKDWYLDESRQVGDTGLVKSDYGYHIMYLDSAKLIWTDRVKEILEYNESAAFINAALEKYEMEVDYEKILIGEVDLAKMMGIAEDQKS